MMRQSCANHFLWLLFCGVLSFSHLSIAIWVWAISHYATSIHFTINFRMRAFTFASDALDTFWRSVFPHSLYYSSLSSSSLHRAAMIYMCLHQLKLSANVLHRTHIFPDSCLDRFPLERNSRENDNRLWSRTEFPRTNWFTANSKFRNLPIYFVFVLLELCLVWSSR